MVETLALIWHQRKLTFLLVEQNLEFITALSQRVLILQKGLIVREVSSRFLGDPIIHEFMDLA